MRGLDEDSLIPFATFIIINEPTLLKLATPLFIKSVQAADIESTADDTAVPNSEIKPVFIFANSEQAVLT